MATKRTTGPKPKPTEGITVRAKWLMIERGLTISIDDLCAKLETEGYKVSRGSIQTLMGDFRQSCRVLWRLDKLKGLSVDQPKADKPKTTKKPKKPKKAKAAKADTEQETAETEPLKAAAA